MIIKLDEINTKKKYLENGGKFSTLFEDKKTLEEENNIPINQKS